MNTNYYIGGIKQVVPKGVVSIERMLKAISQPTPKTISIIEAVRSSKDENKKAYHKQQLPFFTPAIQCTYRNYESIVCFTQILVYDFDKIDNAPEFKDFIFNEHKEIMAAWLSSSGRGVRFLVQSVGINSVEDYKELWWGFAKKNLEMYNGFDTAPQNPVLPLFISIDKKMLKNEAPAVWNEKYVEPKRQEINHVVYYPKEGKNYFKGIEEKINNIYDNGHPQLRSAALWLGNYVGKGFIERGEAELWIENKIRNHSYLGVKSKVNSYIKTAKKMIEYGINS
jgi:hypothetical protein